MHKRTQNLHLFVPLMRRGKPSLEDLISLFVLHIFFESQERSLKAADRQ